MFLLTHGFGNTFPSYQENMFCNRTPPRKAAAFWGFEA